MTTIPIKRKKDRKTSPSIILLSDYIFDKFKIDRPTPFLAFGKNILIDIQIAAIRAIYDNSSEIIICCGFGADAVSEHIKKRYRGGNIRIVENNSYESKTCVEGLRISLNNIDNDSILVVDGYLLLYPEVFTNFNPNNFILSQKEKFLNLDIGFIHDENNSVTNFSYGLPNKWSEIFYINGYENIDKLRSICCLENSGNKMLFEILNETNLKFNIMDNNFPIIKIVDSKTKNKVRKMYEDINTGLFVRSI
jgi:hypothetical protein